MASRPVGWHAERSVVASCPSERRALTCLAPQGWTLSELVDLRDGHFIKWRQDDCDLKGTELLGRVRRALHGVVVSGPPQGWHCRIARWAHPRDSCGPCLALPSCRRVRRAV